MKRLIQSEIWRDGGSLSAIVEDRQRVTSFWLQTNSWDRPTDREHLKLFVSDGEQPELKQTQVGVGSVEVARWTEFLSEASVEGATDESKERFSELLQVLLDRQDRQAQVQERSATGETK